MTTENTHTVDPNLLEQAKERLFTMLQKAPRPATEILENLELDGISKRTAKRAKQALKIVAYQKNGRWFWSLPISENHVG